MAYTGFLFYLTLVLQLMLDQMVILAHRQVCWKRMTATNSVALSLMLVHLLLEVVLRRVVPTSQRWLAAEVSVTSAYTSMTPKVCVALIACVLWPKRHLECANLLSLEGQESTAVIQVVDGALSRRLF